MKQYEKEALVNLLSAHAARTAYRARNPLAETTDYDAVLTQSIINAEREFLAEPDEIDT